MRFARVTERAPSWRALFRFCLRRATLRLALVVAAWTGASGAAADCVADRIDERATVAHVHDGDTLVLADGRKVRLIGINAPELAREDTPGQPYAREARDALANRLAPGQAIGLRFDAERLDHYGRLLAHLYYEDGTSIQAALLDGGYAIAIAVPPNVWNQECYRHAEEKASRAASGLWRLPYYRPLDAVRIRPDEAEGFRLIRGKVLRAGNSANSVWLNLEGGLALRIARSDLHYFPAFNPRELVGKTVVARGWLRTRGGASMMMQVRHPAALRVEADEGTLH